tara:strand:- start:163 stop:345 length:183 start_codon:yes stop_codon:yes gene_type:complete
MTHHQIALQVAQTMDKDTADRYDLIWSIKEIFLVSSPELVTCRDTIDSILDELFEMGYKS